MGEEKAKKKKKRKWWYWVLWIIIILLILNYINNQDEKWKEENCELTFNTYTYNVGCANACYMKCGDEGFSTTYSSGFFEPYLSAEEMANTELYKRCECNCGGCRER